MDHPVHRQQRQQVLGSHKVNCGACIECKEDFMYENENIVSSNQMNKFLKISQLRKDIIAGKEVSTRKHTYMKLPREGVHLNHPIKSVSSLFNLHNPYSCNVLCINVTLATALPHSTSR